MRLLAVISVLHSSLAVAGIAAGLIPVIIHLIHRRRHRRVEWAAMMFLLSAMRRRARRVRLEHWLLLAVRALAITICGLALARPYLTASPLIPLGPSPFHRVVMLDNSGSMGAAWRGEGPTTGETPTAFEHGTDLALQLIESFPKSDEVSIVSLAQPADPLLSTPSSDRRRIRDAITGIRLTNRPADPEGAFRRAKELLDKSSVVPENTSVYVVSDFARGSWSSNGAEGNPLTTAAGLVAEQADLVLIPANSAQATVANVGVTDLALTGTLIATGIPVRFVAEVANYGDHEVSDAVLQVRLADGTGETERVIRHINLPSLAPQRVERVGFSTVFDTPGTHGLHLRAVAAESGSTEQPNTGGDQFALDNDRWIVADVRSTLSVLLVDGAPGRTRLSGQTGYLRTALNPWTKVGGEALVTARTISEFQLAGEVLTDYQVVALCNVSRLEPAVWQHLRKYVRRGGGLVVFSGETVDVDHYNRYAATTGDELLPGVLSPAEGGLATAAEDRGGLGLTTGEPVHPVVADFESRPRSGLFTARVHRRTPLDPDESVAETVLRYTNGEPAIAIRRYGLGRCGVVTTSADMAWSNLPARGDYVSLMMNLVAYLAQPPRTDRMLEVGQPIVRRLSMSETSLPLRVRLPNGSSADVSLSATDDGYTLRHEDTEQVGLYGVMVGGHPELRAVNPPTSESDLRPLGPDELTKLLDAELRYVDQPDELLADVDQPHSRELGFGMLYIVLVLLIGEMWLTLRQSQAQVAGPPTSRRQGARANP